MSKYFPEPKSSWVRVKVKLDLDLLNHPTKAGLTKQQVLIYQNLLKTLL